MNLKEYWIKEVQQIKEFEEMSNSEGIEIVNLQDEIANLIDDQFIEVATERGIARREKMLKIQPFADDTLDSRRFRVMVKWNNQLPYTYRQLEKKLTDLMGANGYTITLNGGQYTLEVKINLGQKRMMQDADLMIRNMAPCNLVISVSLQYNRHTDLGRFTHAQLKAYTHQNLREEVIS